MPRKDSETLPAIFLANSPKHDDDSSQPTSSTSPKPAQKPKIAPILTHRKPIVLSRLNAFLPAISAANRDLESEVAAGTIGSRNIENIDAKDEVYIEMDLGLGVLKQLDTNNPSGSESDDEDEGEDENKEDDILGKLLQRPARGSKPGIEEVEQDRVTAKPKPDDDMEIDPLEKR